MEKLTSILSSNEDWLMERILGYAKERGYSAYTSTLKEPWRQSISGLTSSLNEAAIAFNQVPEMGPDEDFTHDPSSRFGLAEAQRHRERGVALGMFLGLMKYYRQAYLDLIETQGLCSEEKDRFTHFIRRVFDRIEIAFCVEWAGGDEPGEIRDLQLANRVMTNEKNKYLTMFESIPNPVFMLNQGRKIDNMNLAAAGLFKAGAVAGAQYYCVSRDRQLEAQLQEECLDAAPDPSCFSGYDFSQLLPWLQDEVDELYRSGRASEEFEKLVEGQDGRTIFRVKLCRSLDVSDKFEGVLIILEDIITLKNALDEVRTLRGFIPICANCKNIRDDHGYWQRVEEYVTRHSEAQFSHSICPDCARKLYPQFVTD